MLTLRILCAFALLIVPGFTQNLTVEQIAAQLRVVNEQLAVQKTLLDANTLAQVSLAREASSISKEIGSLSAQIGRLSAALSNLVDPDPPTPLPDDESAPDFSRAPFAALMPKFPEYRVPTLEDGEWTIANGVATSR
jgi:hypothetical protein